MKDKCKDCYFSDNGNCTCSGIKMCVSNHDERRQTMTNKEAIEILKPLTGYNVDKNGIGTFPMVSTPLQAEALDLAIKALHIVDIINEELSPADEDKAIWFDIPYWEEIQERADKEAEND